MASDSRMAGPADHRGVSLDLGASLSDARQRPRLWTCLHVSGEGDGYSRSADLSWVTVAEWNCRAPHRHPASRVPGPYGHLQRDAPAANSFRLCSVLQSSAHAFGIGEGRPVATGSSTLWRHRRHSYSGWTAPPIRPDMIFGRDNLLLRHQLSISEARHKRGHTPPRPVMLTKVPDYVAYECRVNSVAPAPGPKGTESWR
jgi:hypothetical protein